MSRRQLLDEKRKSDEGDTLNAESAKRSEERVGIHEGEAESARREVWGNKRARDSYRVVGKDQWEAAAVLVDGGDEN